MKKYSNYASLLSFGLLLNLNDFSVYAMGNGNEEKIDSKLVYRKVKSILEENRILLNSSHNKNIIIFLGKTGAGKSTLINYLGDKDLIVNDLGDIILRNPQDTSAMKIGIGNESETSLPKFIQTSDFLFYDLPGFSDTRGIEVNLVNACFIKHLIENAQTTKIAFVASLSETDAQRGNSFKELLEITKKLIPGETIEDFSSLIITKVTPDKKNTLINYLLQKTPPGLLNSWIHRSRLSKMFVPYNQEIDQSDKVNIINIIRNTEAKKINYVNIDVIYGLQQRYFIKDLYKEEITFIIDDSITKKLNLNSSNIEDLKRQKQYFERDFSNELSTSILSSSLIKLLKPISENIYTSTLTEMDPQTNLKRTITLSQIGIKIEEKERIKAQQEAEKQRLIALENERKRREEEQLRIQAQQQAEQLHLAAQETERKLREEEEKRRIDAENSLKEEEKRRKIGVITEISNSVRSYAVAYDTRRQEAEIQQKKHAGEFQRGGHGGDLRYSAYWEGYALGQQEELKLIRDKMYSVSSELGRIGHMF